MFYVGTAANLYLAYYTVLYLIKIISDKTNNGYRRLRKNDDRKKGSFIGKQTKYDRSPQI